MFSVPSIYKATPAERNEQRFAIMQSKLKDAQARMRHAYHLMNALVEEGYSDMTEEQWATLDMGNVQSIGSYTGSALSAVMRASAQAEETMLEALVLAGGFEPVPAPKTAWFVNEDGGVYEYDREAQLDDFPNDFHIAYETEAKAEAAADALFGEDK